MSPTSLGPTSPVRVGSGPRAILVRPGVGAAGHVVQRSDTLSHRVVIDHATLILVLEGQKRIRWAGGECVGRPGEAVSLHPGEVVDIANTPGRSGTYRALWICWSPELLAEPPTAGTASEPVRLHTGLSDDFRASFHRAFDGLDATGGLPAAVATSRLQEVLLWLAEFGFRFPAPVPASFGQQVRRLLATDPSAAWAMEEVAQTMATSVPTLRRRLVEEGMSFRDLVQEVRMSHALALLENTDAPVLHVALAAGYASASRFTARFRARFGHRPSDLREQRRVELGR